MEAAGQLISRFSFVLFTIRYIHIANLAVNIYIVVFHTVLR